MRGRAIPGRDRAAFTLIEMMAVVFIVALLTSIAAVAVAKVLVSAKRASAGNMVSQIVTGWRTYLVDNRSFPTNKVVQYMDIATLGVLNARHTYLEVSEKEKKAGGLRDPWGQLYRVGLDSGSGWDSGAAYDGEINPPHGKAEREVLAWSPGPDKRDGTRDDIRSWRE